jgi:galactan endo-1,6-beta-galactosidase
MRSPHLIGVLFALAGACLLSPAPRVRAADAVYVKLIQVDSGKALGVADDSDEAGARVVLAKDGDGKGLQWKLEKDGDYYKVANRKSGKVLDVSGESTDEGGEIIQWDDKTDGNDNQRWAWEGEGKERRLKSKSSGLVLDMDDDKAVQKKADEKAKTQLWRVVEVKE